ncbi:OLC1v1005460C1 [Oldenlandia corymbosa var. corymbosa]|uniref:OLC1v1005460C1 n=1 Tax=Oldenlandia corymbosa var. corymbosa TaxID=529605 RepID=A0AAV1DEN8_OLDCO|nr:OLC1v1005460C1 [Oldenlandia corymbosa var. corymbosa]
MDCLNNKLSIICLLLLLLLLLVLPYPSATLPLCTDLRAPVKPKKPLTFCPYDGKACCDSSQDSQLRQRFDALNISDSACASAVKSILCATCDQFSADLFKVQSGPRTIPVLCNSTTDGGAPSKSQGQAVDNFCSNVWDVCQNVSIPDSPFAPSLHRKTAVPESSNPYKLTDLWPSKTEFCNAFGGVSGEDSVCFDGKQVSVLDNEELMPPKGMCLEKIGKGSYLNMAPHPDGSNRAFFSDQPGKVWLATIPEQDSGAALGLDESSPFVDLTDEVYLDSIFGMMGLAFHPDFARNGRFFASYNCDKIKSPGCTGRCACNSDVDCDPSQIVSPDGTPPCKDYVVVSEFSANGSSSSTAEKGNPSEVRRIFTMGIPFGGDHGGQILFGPEDGYLYLMMGDGGGKSDQYNFAQNKKSLLGKIMRLDVNNMPSEKTIADLNLWGNYSIPSDNPFSEDKQLQPEIWAMGLRNPWRCSFDSERPSYFVCGDIGQDQYEEVDLITKGGNYGWRMLEGPILFQNQTTTPNITLVNSNDTILPVAGYNHSDVNKKEGSAAISGGYFYRSTTDPCSYGSYFYGDLYAKNIWAALENPKNSGNFTTTSIPFSCAADSPLPCSSVPNSPLPALSYIFSFGEDNRKDLFILTMSGVYRVVRPSRCNYTCSKENVAASTPHQPPPPAASSSNTGSYQLLNLLLPLCFVVFVLCRLDTVGSA